MPIKLSFKKRLERNKNRISSKTGKHVKTAYSCPAVKKCRLELQVVKEKLQNLIKTPSEAFEREIRTLLVAVSEVVRSNQKNRKKNPRAYARWYALRREINQITFTLNNLEKCTSLLELKNVVCKKAKELKCTPLTFTKLLNDPEEKEAIEKIEAEKIPMLTSYVAKMPPAQTIFPLMLASLVGIMLCAGITIATTQVKDNVDLRAKSVTNEPKNHYVSNKNNPKMNMQIKSLEELKDLRGLSKAKALIDLVNRTAAEEVGWQRYKEDLDFAMDNLMPFLAEHFKNCYSDYPKNSQKYFEYVKEFSQPCNSTWEIHPKDHSSRWYEKKAELKDMFLGSFEKHGQDKFSKFPPEKFARHLGWQISEESKVKLIDGIKIVTEIIPKYMLTPQGILQPTGNDLSLLARISLEELKKRAKHLYTLFENILSVNCLTTIMAGYDMQDVAFKTTRKDIMEHLNNKTPVYLLQSLVDFVESGKRYETQTFLLDCFKF
jgi:hypothetical protein